MTTATPTQSSGPNRTRRIIVLIAVAVAIAVVVAAFLVWLVFFSTTAPPAPSIENAAGILSATPVPE